MRTLALAVAFLAGCTTQAVPTSQPLPQPAPDPIPSNLALRSKAHNLMDSAPNQWQTQEVAGIK